jgi:hypothetical protein
MDPNGDNTANTPSVALRIAPLRLAASAKVIKFLGLFEMAR